MGSDSEAKASAATARRLLERPVTLGDLLKAAAMLLLCCYLLLGGHPRMNELVMHNTMQIRYVAKSVGQTRTEINEHVKHAVEALSSLWNNTGVALRSLHNRTAALEAGSFAGVRLDKGQLLAMQALFLAAGDDVEAWGEQGAPESRMVMLRMPGMRDPASNTSQLLFSPIESSKQGE